MLSKLMTFLLAAREPADNGNKLTRILPVLIIMVLYAISGLFKNKGRKPRSSQQPKPANRQQTSGPQPLPGYARKSQEIQRQQGQPARLKNHSRDTVRKEDANRQDVRRDAAQTKAAVAQRTMATAKRLSADQKLSRTQMQSVGESKRLNQPTKTSGQESRVKETTAADFLENLMRNENALAQAVIYSEIIGKPLFSPTRNLPPGLESIM